MADSRRPRPALEHREDHRGACRLDAAGGSARRLQRRRCDECLHLAEQRAAAVEGDRHAGARDRLDVAGHEQAGRVGHLDDAVVGQVEAAHLVDRAEAVLHRADEPQPRRAVALEVQHDVDQVLERTRSGDAALLGDVADQQGGDAAPLGDLDQAAGHLAHLRHAAGHPVGVGGADGLHRVDHHQGRAAPARCGRARRRDRSRRRGRARTPPRRCARRAAAPVPRTPRR